MIGEFKLILKMVSEIEEEHGVDVRFLQVADSGGVVRVSMKILLPPDKKVEKAMKIKRSLSKFLDTFGGVISGDVLEISGYILSGKEP